MFPLPEIHVDFKVSESKVERCCVVVVCCVWLGWWMEISLDVQLLYLLLISSLQTARGVHTGRQGHIECVFQASVKQQISHFPMPPRLEKKNTYK